MSSKIKEYIRSLKNTSLNSRILEHTFFIKNGEKFHSGIFYDKNNYDPYTLHKSMNVISFEKTNIFKYLNEGIVHPHHSKKDKVYNEKLIRNFIALNYKENLNYMKIAYLHNAKNIKKILIPVDKLLSKHGIKINNEYTNILNQNKMMLLNLLDMIDQNIDIRDNFYDIFDLLVVFFDFKNKFNFKNKEDTYYGFKFHYETLINSLLNKRIGKNFLYKMFKMNIEDLSQQVILHFLENLLLCKTEVELEFIKNKTIRENSIGIKNNLLYLSLIDGDLINMVSDSAKNLLLEFENFKIRYKNKKTFFKLLAS